MTERVTLKPGDYVSTVGVDGDQYRSVVSAFINAGAVDRGDAEFDPETTTLGWDHRDDELWVFDGRSIGFTGKELTPSQVLAATNAGGQPEKPRAKRYRAVDSPFFSDGSIVEVDIYETDSSSLFRLISGHCKHDNAKGRRPGAWDSFKNMEPVDMQDTLTTTLNQASEHDAKAKHHAAEHDRLMEQARDMLPDGWRLVRDEEPKEDMTDPANWREGDVVECVNEGAQYCHIGGLYVVNSDHLSPNGGRFRIKSDDDGDAGTPKLSYFRFHHRP